MQFILYFFFSFHFFKCFNNIFNIKCRIFGYDTGYSLCWGCSSAFFICSYDAKYKCYKNKRGPVKICSFWGATYISFCWRIICYFSGENLGFVTPKIDIEELFQNGNSNTKAIGLYLYTDYFIIFQMSAYVLLVAMIGAIVLAYKDKRFIKSQNVYIQNTVRKEDLIKLVDSKKNNTKIMGASNFLILSSIVFSIGLLGIFVNRKNMIIILMSIELMLLAVNINFVGFSYIYKDLSGQLFSMFILVVAAEAAVGLAILTIFFKNKGTITVDKISKMKG